MYMELKDINKHFNNYKASDHVSFGIEKGKLIGLLGPSGSGKTTILRMIAGLEQPDSGEIIIDGKVVNDVPASKRGIGFVFQNYALFRYMTVYDNIAFGLKVQKVDKKTIDKRVKELIELIGLKGLDKRYPSQLSGGQRQRVAFARALAPNPQLLLLDEPFAAIDAKVRQELRSWLKASLSHTTKMKPLKWRMKLSSRTRAESNRWERRWMFIKNRRQRLLLPFLGRLLLSKIIRHSTPSKKSKEQKRQLYVQNS